MATNLEPRLRRLPISTSALLAAVLLLGWSAPALGGTITIQYQITSWNGQPIQDPSATYSVRYIAAGPATIASGTATLLTLRLPDTYPPSIVHPSQHIPYFILGRPATASLLTTHPTHTHRASFLTRWRSGPSLWGTQSARWSGQLGNAGPGRLYVYTTMIDTRSYPGLNYQIADTYVGQEINTTYDASPLLCGDGLDNDGDGLIDYPADPGCHDLLDNSETPEPIQGKMTVKIKLRFDEPKKDKIAVKVQGWALPAGLVPTDVTVNLGGVLLAGTLDAKGRYKSPDGLDRITMKQGRSQLWRIVAKRKKDDFAADLADEGCTSADHPKPGIPVTVPLTIEVGGLTFSEDVGLRYRSKLGKTGIAK